MHKTFSFLRCLGLFNLIAVIFFIAACSSNSDDATEIKVTNIEIANAVSSIALDSKLALAATALLDNGEKSDYTSLVTWTSSDSSIATIAADGTITAIAAGTVTITAKYNTFTVSVTIEITTAQLTALSISPQNKNILVSQSLAMVATGIYNNGSKQDITNQVSWSSSNSALASVQQNLVTGVAAGNATITATLGSLTSTTTVKIADPTLASIQLSVPETNLIAGLAIEITANGLFDDNKSYDISSQVTWKSSDTSVATFNKNKLSLLKAGTVEITASNGSVSSKRNLTISNATLQSLTVEPVNNNLHAGETTQLIALAFYSNNESSNVTNQVVWSIDKTTLALVSNTQGQEGIFTALAAGEVTISATLDSISASKKLNINTALLEKITLNLASNSIAKGTTLALTATAIYADGTSRDITRDVIWQSSNNAIASIETAGVNTGLLHGLSKGDVTVTATSGTIQTTTTISISDATLTSIVIENVSGNINTGSELPARATGNFSDGTQQDITDQVTWVSDSTSVADVSNDPNSSGVISGISTGETVIGAILDDVKTSVELTVSNSTLQQIVIAADSTSLAVGTRLQLRANGIYSDKSTRDIRALVNWQSSNTSALPVSNIGASAGEITAMTLGDHSVTAQLEGISASINIAVTAAILDSLEISPSSITIVKNTAGTLVATGVFSDNSRQDLSQQVVWQAADETIANVSTTANQAIHVNGINQGSTTITASVEGKVASATVTVNANVLKGITLIADDFAAAIAAGYTKTVTAIGTFDDNSTQDITDQVAWSTSDTAVCRMIDSTNEPGIVTGLSKGNCQLSASMQNISNNMIFSITDATLVSLALTPTTATIAKGSQISLIATGTYSDNSTSDISSQVTWQGSGSAISVSNQRGDKGQVMGLSEGSGTVQAEINGKSASADITVSSATLQDITISTEFPTIYKGTLALFKAEATYTDNSKQDVSTQVIWSSSDDTIAKISNAKSVWGLLYAIEANSVTISAALSGFTKNQAITIVDDPMIPVSISLSPTPNVILNNGTDASTININVNAVDKTKQVANGTTVNLSIIYGAGTLNQASVTTTSGQVSFNFKSSTKGFTIIKASIPNSLIVNYATVYTTDDFSEMIKRRVVVINPGIDSNGMIKPGTIFGFTITNLSNREFNLLQYQINHSCQACQVLDDSNSNSATEALLGDKLLSANESVSIGYKVETAVPNSVAAGYKLSDTATGKEMTIGASMKLTPVAKPSN